MDRSKAQRAASYAARSLGATQGPQKPTVSAQLEMNSELFRGLFCLNENMPTLSKDSLNLEKKLLKNMSSFHSFTDEIMELT